MLDSENFKPIIETTENYIEDNFYNQSVKIPIYGLPLSNNIRLVYSDMLRLNGKDVSRWEVNPPARYTPIEKAMYIAINCHYGQTDRIGVPYIYHCMRVASAQTTDEAVLVALMHDIYNFPFSNGERFNPYSRDMLVSWFGENIERWVSYLRQAYTCNLMNDIACNKDLFYQSDIFNVVKADIKDNLRPGISESSRQTYLKLLSHLTQ